MGISIARSITKLVTFNIDQDITAQTEHTFNIPLTRNDWETGYLTLWATNTGAPERRSMFIIVTRDINEVYDQSVYLRAGFMTKGYMGYTIENWDYAGFSYAVGSSLSLFSYGKYGKYIKLKSAEIDDSNMKLIFYNKRTITVNLKMTGVVRLTRKKLK